MPLSKNVSRAAEFVGTGHSLRKAIVNETVNLVLTASSVIILHCLSKQFHV